VADVIQLSRATYGKMVQNLFWATGYNVVAIPLAAGVLFTWGIPRYGSCPDVIEHGYRGDQRTVFKDER
jgi:hypothetical protein